MATVRLYPVLHAAPKSKCVDANESAELGHVFAVGAPNNADIQGAQG